MPEAGEARAKTGEKGPKELRVLLRTNDCPTGPSVPYENGNAKCVSYGPCRNGTYVELCVIEGGGHAWPSCSQYLPVDKIGPVSYDISFDQIWEFFQKPS